MYIPEPGNKKQNHTDANIRKQYTHPDLVGQRLHKGEHTSFLELCFLDHNTDAKTHVWFGEINDAFSLGVDCDWCNSQVHLLMVDKQNRPILNKLIDTNTDNTTQNTLAPDNIILFYISSKLDLIREIG